ncbi:MAG TPA: ATP-binding cassette domain-containing protein [Lacisediminihabitans sp.]|uniref:ATP-binding cassette domain-containing protein n=1 Tax=Lacisediminihabitans sp. TaxID=2787631 RepID=UPI002EDAED43
MTGGLDATRIDVRIDGRLIVDGVDCTVEPGTFSAMIGPNGAGKSSLLRVLATVERPHAGAVSFAGRDLFALPRRTRARLVTFVEQDSSTDLSLRVRDVVALGRIPHQGMFGESSAEDRRIVDAALASAGAAALADRDYTGLSGGERQHVLLAKALAQQPELLLLDEPSNHLDIAAQLALLDLLKGLAAEGVTVLAALHDLNLASAYCDHVVVLRGGRVFAAGPTSEVLTAELIREVYGVRASVIEHPQTGRPLVAFGSLR